MNTHKETNKPKGLSVEGFWRQIQDRTSNTDDGIGYVDSHDVSESISKMDPQDAPKRTDDDWLTRLDEWLDKL